MNDSQTVHLEEYKQLRDEIKTRLTLSNQLVAYTVTALAAGIAIFEKYPDAILGLTLVTSCFWLLWLDQSAQIFKIAYYIAIRLAPRLCVGDDEVLGWEPFVRKLDNGTLQEMERIPLRGGVRPIRAAFVYTEFLLGGSAGGLVVFYFFLMRAGSVSSNRARICVLTLAAVLWIYTLVQAIRVAMANREIGKSILANEARRILPL
jgi:hypothetical protein